jgi:hypothetical protein
VCIIFLLEVLFVDLDVGQIIFLLANKEAKVYPALVSEQINKKTLSGTEISYVIMLPDNEATCVELSKIDAEVLRVLKMREVRWSKERLGKLTKYLSTRNLFQIDLKITYRMMMKIYLLMKMKTLWVKTAKIKI